jgi:hypothetical protein
VNLWQRLNGALTGLDQALNALGGGSPRQTISGTAWRAFKRGNWWGWPMVAIIDGLLGHGHCERVAAAEAARG